PQDRRSPSAAAWEPASKPWACGEKKRVHVTIAGPGFRITVGEIASATPVGSVGRLVLPRGRRDTAPRQACHREVRAGSVLSFWHFRLFLKEKCHATAAPVATEHRGT